jgi:hypothetical protein
MSVLSSVIDIKTILVVYHALFVSLLQYDIEMWGSSSSAEMILKIQKKYIRITTFSSPRTSCSNIFKELKILTLPSIYILRCLLWIKQNLASIVELQHNLN